jgi:predicted nucleic acid-binding protein
MLDPAGGPFLFDTSAESWLARSQDSGVRAWVTGYLAHYPIHVSAVTVMERVRGFAWAWRKTPGRRAILESARTAYLSALGTVHPVDTAIALLAAEVTALIPHPVTPPVRSHRESESRGERLVRWRNDILIAATALANDMLLLHNNAPDFEAIRSAIESHTERFPAIGPLKLMRCTLVA